MTRPRFPLRKSHSLAIAILLVLGIAGAVAILNTAPARPAAGHGHGHAEGAGHDHGEGQAGEGHAHAEGEHDDHGQSEDGDAHDSAAEALGPHGGQLFTEGGFGLEALLSEGDGPPRLKVWLYRDGRPLPATAARLGLTLQRPGAAAEEIAFEARQDHLLSVQPIAEPHVFEATLAARTDSEPYLFTFSRQEGLIRLTGAQLKAAGITLATSGPARIQSSLQLPGEIRFNEDRTAHVVPRVPGVVEQVSADLGQRVRKGQVLAVLSSPLLAELRSELQAAQKRLVLARKNHEREQALYEEKISPQQDVLQAQQALHEAEIAVAGLQQKLQALGAGPAASALNRFELRAPFDAVVVEKHLALGEAVKEDSQVFTLSDLSTVWATIDVPAGELPQVRVGARVSIRASAFAETATGTVAHVGALIGERTRTAQARVALSNPQGAWRPGLFVTVGLVAAEAELPVTVATEALQTLDEQQVVFVRHAGGFLPQPVKTGRSDGRRVEILQGLQAGAAYAAAGSFVLKSEVGKATAEHVH
ncbi:efflux RND transporter periplasmic adaptor subunit (plasmid) [Eleftheria terrae]|nr:efflux RND transporter periplasmic adaptor subunit [Eleftheria terrae]WKB55497.1 efflux RND transporter periplasmic adaptor subunit [Eleftheria terrae]